MYLVTFLRHAVNTPNSEQTAQRPTVHVFPELYSIHFGTFTFYIPTQSTSMTLSTIYYNGTNKCKSVLTPLAYIQ